MIGLSNSYLTDARNFNPNYWASKRAAAMAAVYPSGALTGYPDTVDSNWNQSPMWVTPLAGLAKVVRYTVASPGGRSGGSAAHVHALVPSAYPSGKCLVFHAGHGTATTEHGGWSSNDCVNSDGSSVILRMLARGWIVLAVDLPNYGLQPLPQSVVINGSLVTQTAWNLHAPNGSASPFDSPSITRLYTDHVVLAMNAAVRDLGATKFALVGHSGGGAVAAMLALVESRFSVVHLVQGFSWDTSGSGTSDDWEGWSANDVLVAARDSVGGGFHDAANVGATYPNRVTVIHEADSDEFIGDQHTYWQEWVWNTNSWVKSATNNTSSLSFYRKTTGGHYIDATQAAWIEAHLVANV